MPRSPPARQPRRSLRENDSYLYSLTYYLYLRKQPCAPSVRAACETTKAGYYGQGSVEPFACIDTVYNVLQYGFKYIAYVQLQEQVEEIPRGLIDLGLATPRRGCLGQWTRQRGSGNGCQAARRAFSACPRAYNRGGLTTGRTGRSSLAFSLPELSAAPKSSLTASPSHRPSSLSYPFVGFYFYAGGVRALSLGNPIPTRMGRHQFHTGASNRAAAPLDSILELLVRSPALSAHCFPPLQPASGYDAVAASLCTAPHRRPEGSSLLGMRDAGCGVGSASWGPLAFIAFAAGSHVNWQLLAHARGSISTAIATAYDTLGPAGPTSPTAPRSSPSPSSSPPCSPSSPNPLRQDGTPTPKLLVQLADITVLPPDDLRKRGQAAIGPSVLAARRPVRCSGTATTYLTADDVPAARAHPRAVHALCRDADGVWANQDASVRKCDGPAEHRERRARGVGDGTEGDWGEGAGGGHDGDLKEFRPSIMVRVPAVWETVRKGMVGKVQAGSAIWSSVFKGAVEAKERGTPGLARLADSVILSGGKAAMGAADDRDERGLLGVAWVILLQGASSFASFLLCRYGMCAMCAIIPPEVFPFDFVGLPVSSIEIKGAAEERGAVRFSPFFALLLFLSSLPSSVLCFVGSVFDLGGRPFRPRLGSGRSILVVENWPRWTLQGETGVLGERGPSCIAELVWLMLVRVRYTGHRIPEVVGVMGVVYGVRRVVYGLCCGGASSAGLIGSPPSRVLDARVDPKVAALVLRECNAVGKKSGLNATATLTAVVLTPDEWTPGSGLVTAAQKIQRSAIAKKFDREIKEAYKNRSPNSAKATLPVELWYTIIREITDKDLLRVSAVCSTFNAFAISEYLARHDISTAAKEITGPAYIIHPLQLSCIPLPVEHLVCHFRPYNIRRDLLSLQRFVPRAQHLRDLELSFAGSLLHAHCNDRIPVEYSARELMSIFCRVLSGMASKAAGPVVVVGQFAMFVCRAEEIAGWRLDGLQFSPLSERNTLMAKIRGIAGGPSTTITLRTTVQMSGTQPEPLTREQVLENLRTVNVWVHNAPGVDYTMLVFNISSITLLDLNDSPIPDEQLAAVLRDLTLPCLETLSISRSGIDPTALGGFLAQQPRLRHFTSFARKPSSPLISSPLSHPTLINMKAVGTENICLAMDALHLSPLLETFMFSYTHNVSSSLSNLTPAFRLLSQRSSNAHLELTVSESSPDSNPSSSSMDEPLFDDEAASTSRTLHCVYSVVISCSSADMGLRILPWLALFPRLLKVKFYLNVTGRDPRPDDPLREVELKRLMETRVFQSLFGNPGFSGCGETPPNAGSFTDGAAQSAFAAG
ncbi:hypothetical protein C8F04DRAFT_1330281 [Mycena alexandri]|uniref:F-box domain-containing protein n=1 Tax=Mycena alexandri TaxID=1745969 RepID=A0AAD6RZU5_9AGAR|nr:hypothetical protein C8F04DRAFT_1330281 [Mycena alexandri]